MKKILKQLTAIFLFALIFVAYGVAQQVTGLQYFIPSGKERINQFESPKTNTVEFNGLKIYVGGDFALQYQGISQSNSGDSLADIGNNFNLPTANMNIDVQLAPGMRMHLRTYLSSKHHTEAYVKGGYLQVDQLDFIEAGFLSGLMEVLTIKVGMDEFNYGDAHFRRSDNSYAMVNPFVGNYLMDSFSTEPFIEFTVQSNGIVAVLGATNGRLNQNVAATDDGFVLFGKAGYDSQINEDLRIRLTGSFYNSTDKGTRDYLYGGDRAGSRYYGVITDSDFSGRFNPGFSRSPVGGYITAFQINPFVKFQGFEFFGVFEVANNGADEGGGFTQLGAEALYRFGADENFYFGGRYNLVTGEETDASESIDIDRINVGAGWFLTKNVLTKLEFVSQTYGGDGYDGTLYQEAEFSGVVLEAVIAF
ncbi:MAG: hypothetical protein ED557_02565 [Balneola sp.]|nr:MAG: hypothetical protein ED557_02565 [Balneola sp.]